jgi:predicted GNAT family acetyltransferase
VTEISWIFVSEKHRRQGLASGLLTAQVNETVARGEVVGYYAGSAGEDLDAMLRRLGFREKKETYRFIPAAARDQWRACWGRPV